MSVLFLEGETQNSCPWGEIVAQSVGLNAFFKKNWFIYWLRWVFVALGRLFLVVSSCGKWGLPFSVVCGLLTAAAPLVEEHLLGVLGFRSCGTRAWSLHGMWGLPRPGIEPVSLCCQAGSLTTGPPGMPSEYILTVYSFLKVFFFKAVSLKYISLIIN